MSDALEVTIRAALTTALRQITPGNGYYTALGDHVFDGPRSVDKLSPTVYPCCWVKPGDEAPAAGCMGGPFGSVFEFWVDCYAKVVADALDDELSRIKADVKRAVLTDSSLGLGAVVNDTDWGGAQRAVDVTDASGFGRTALRFLVSADWSPSAA